MALLEIGECEEFKEKKWSYSHRWKKNIMEINLRYVCPVWGLKRRLWNADSFCIDRTFQEVSAGITNHYRSVGSRKLSVSVGDRTRAGYAHADNLNVSYFQ